MKKPHFVSKMRFFKAFSGFYGGDKRDRTADLLNAIQALSQLSYTPIFCCAVRQLLYYNTIVSKVKGYFGIFLFFFFLKIFDPF